MWGGIQCCLPVTTSSTLIRLTINSTLVLQNLNLFLNFLSEKSSKGFPLSLIILCGCLSNSTIFTFCCSMFEQFKR